MHFLQSNFHLQLYEIYLNNIFDTSIPIIMLDAFELTCSTLFGKHILLDGSPRVSLSSTFLIKMLYFVDNFETSLAISIISFA